VICLLSAEGLRGVETGGSPGGEDAGSAGGESEDKDDSGEDGPVERAHAVEHGTDEMH
jgi:hypothetical protein